MKSLFPKASTLKSDPEIISATPSGIMREISDLKYGVGDEGRNNTSKHLELPA